MRSASVAIRHRIWSWYWRVWFGDSKSNLLLFFPINMLWVQRYYFPFTFRHIFENILWTHRKITYFMVRQEVLWTNKKPTILYSWWMKWVLMKDRFSHFSSSIIKNGLFKERKAWAVQFTLAAEVSLPQIHPCYSFSPKGLCQNRVWW